MSPKSGKSKERSPFWREAPPANEPKLVSLASGGKLDEIRALLDAGAPVNSMFTSDQGTALYYATTRRYTDVMRELLQRGADPNLPDLHGRTPLWIATNDGNEAGTMLLLEYGASTEFGNLHGVTPFVNAIYLATRGDQDQESVRRVIAAVVAKTAHLDVRMPSGLTAREVLPPHLRDVLPPS
jgi:hypothetical protein